MSERLDITRPLKTRGGSEVRGVQELPQPWLGSKEYALGGLLQMHNGEWCFETWTASGQYYADESTSDNDLIYADEPEPESKPDADESLDERLEQIELRLADREDAACNASRHIESILDRLHQIEQRLGDIVAKATARANEAKGCPFARLNAWRAGGGVRWWIVESFEEDYHARAYVDGKPKHLVTAQSPHLAAEALCTELGI